MYRGEAPTRLALLVMQKLPPQYIVALAQWYYALSIRARSAWNSALALRLRAMLSALQRGFSAIDLSVDAFWHAAPIAALAILLVKIGFVTADSKQILSRAVGAAGDLTAAKAKIKLDAEKQVISSSRRMIERFNEALPHARGEVDVATACNSTSASERALFDAVRAILMEEGDGAAIGEEGPAAAAAGDAGCDNGAAKGVARDAEEAERTLIAEREKAGREHTRVGQLPCDALREAIAESGMTLQVPARDAPSADDAALGAGAVEGVAAAHVEAAVARVAEVDVARAAEHARAAARGCILTSLFMRRQLRYASALTLAAFAKRVLQDKLEAAERRGELSPEAAKVEKRRCALTLFEARHTDRSEIQRRIAEACEFQNEALRAADPSHEVHLRRRKVVLWFPNMTSAETAEFQALRNGGELPLSY